MVGSMRWAWAGPILQFCTFAMALCTVLVSNTHRVHGYSMSTCVQPGALVLRGGADSGQRQPESADEFSVGAPTAAAGDHELIEDRLETKDEQEAGLGIAGDSFSIGGDGEDHEEDPGMQDNDFHAEEELLPETDSDDDDLDAFDDATQIFEEDMDKIVNCHFDRIGDTNGVFYHLGSMGARKTADERLQERSDGHARRPRFVNPALTGRVQVFTGPLRVMCAERLRGKYVQAEDVLERSVVGDEFWFPDGWFAIDLGNHTRLKPTSYLMRSGGGTAEVTTGWILEAANHVEGRWWRVGDWEVIDRHENDTCFLALTEDGSAPGYTGHTKLPTKEWTWRQEPIGELPHHTLSFDVHATKSYRYFRLRQLSNYLNSHGKWPKSIRNFYVQGFEMYGQLHVDHEQDSMPPFKPLFPRGQWFEGVENPDHDSDEEERYCMQWIRGEIDMTKDDKDENACQRRYIQQLREWNVEPPPPRRWDKPDWESD